MRARPQKAVERRKKMLLTEANKLSLSPRQVTKMSARIAELVDKIQRLELEIEELTYEHGKAVKRIERAESKKKRERAAAREAKKAGGKVAAKAKAEAKRKAEARKTSRAKSRLHAQEGGGGTRERDPEPEARASAHRTRVRRWLCPDEGCVASHRDG